MRVKSARKITVAALQLPFGSDQADNVDRVESAVRAAAKRGANIVLPSELFAGPYFPKREDPAFFAWAHPAQGHPTIARMQRLAAELNVAIPVSFFERAGHAYYNALAMIDAGGACLGVYRKSHIPAGPGYAEKFYFSPGNTGFRIWETRFGRIGVGICWDQWYPEAARAMALMGAEILLYPTAIGSEPAEPELDTKPPWQRVMQGHAIANVMPVGAANRVGNEEGQVFYGCSFFTDAQGQILCEAARDREATIVVSYDLDAIATLRASWGFFRDRRPELYGRLLTRDGVTPETGEQG